MNDSEPLNHNFIEQSIDSRSKWHRFWRWLYPYKHCPLPEVTGMASDCVKITTVIQLDWKDRVRVLFSGLVIVTTRTVTQHIVGWTVTGSESYVGTSYDLKELKELKE